MGAYPNKPDNNFFKIMGISIRGSLDVRIALEDFLFAADGAFSVASEHTPNLIIGDLTVEGTFYFARGLFSRNGITIMGFVLDQFPRTGLETIPEQ